MYKRTAHEISDMLARKEVTAVEVTLDIVDRINKVEPKIQAYISLEIDAALDIAKKIDKSIANGKELSPLAGIPMALKDNICMKGIKTTCASKMLEKFISPYDATVVERLKDNGAIILGKANMDEFAMGSSTETSFMNKTKNPYDLERVPGGSSGGSAALVSAGEGYYSLGSDTGGSIRQPASFCGVVGMKPTYGRVSRYGLIAFASSLDQIGPITKDCTDCALVMNMISGKDNRDSTSSYKKSEDFTGYLSNDLKGFKIGIPKEYLDEGIDQGVRKKIMEAIYVLKNQGAEIKEISLEVSKHALEVYYIISSAEASSNLARFDGIRYGHRAKEFEDSIDIYIKSRSEGFGEEVKRRIMLGTYALSTGYYNAYYKKALKVKTLIIEEFKNAFKNVDVIFSPTSPTTAFKLGEKIGSPLQMYLADIFTVPANIAGLPGISIPCGLSNGLPVGIQFVGNYFKEGDLLRVGYAFEKATEHHKIRPNIISV